MKDRSARKAGAKPGWRRSGRYTDIIYQTWDGIAKITINRPEVRNAFRPTTVSEMARPFEVARGDPKKIGVVILTGAGTGPSARAETSASGGTTVTSTRRAPNLLSTCWTCRCRSAACRSR